MRLGDFRPINGIIASLCVLSGGFISGGVNRQVILISLSVFFLVLGGNGINDIFDVEVDRINSPHRALPSGRVSLILWKIFVLLFFILSLLFSYEAGLLHLTFAGIYILLLSLYTPFLKPKFLAGNLSVAVMSGFTFLWGGITAGDIKWSVYPGIFAFLIHLSREIVKDVEDIEGDRKVNARTLPIILGEERSLRISLYILSFLIIVVISSFFLYNIYYIAGMVFLFLIPGIWLTINGLRRLPPPSQFQKRLKLLMLTGLIAITLEGL